MTEIFLIRHTQAEGNLYRMMQGHWDGDVTERGWQQIEALAERFRDIHPDAVYSSDLYRTRMTATAVTRHDGLELKLDRRFREIDLGPWETGFFGNIMHDEPEAMADFINRPGDWYVEGAETYAQVRDRAYGALLDVIARHEGGKIVVVSHGVTIRCLMSRILDADLNDAEKLPIHGNTAVSHLFYDKGSFTVDYVNDQSHLEAMGLPQWNRNASLRHERLDPLKEKSYYISCYEDTWKAAHGSLKGFNPTTYLSNAVSHYLCDKDSVLRFFDGETAMGVLDMDIARGAEDGIGWISLLYITEDYRRKGYGVQLLARAIAKYRGLGRTRLQLNVTEENHAARAFYEKQGFKEVSGKSGALGRLLLLEKSLGVREHA